MYDYTFKLKAKVPLTKLRKYGFSVSKNTAHVPLSGYAAIKNHLNSTLSDCCVFIPIERYFLNGEENRNYRELFVNISDDDEMHTKTNKLLFAFYHMVKEKMVYVKKRK